MQESKSPNEAFYEARAVAKQPTSDNPETVELVSRVASWSKLSDGSRVLDVGCFDGYLLRRLQLKKHLRGVGIDLSRNSLLLAQRLARNEFLAFVQSDATELPFSDECFDIVICSEILEHIPDMELALSEISRVLVKGGRLYATIPNSLDFVWPPLHSTCRLVDRVEGHVRRLSRAEFIRALRTHGMEPVKVQYRGFAASAVWYRAFIYSPKMKQHGTALLQSGNRLLSKVSATLAFAGMRSYLAIDRLFRTYSGCMGIDGVFQKRVNLPVARDPER